MCRRWIRASQRASNARLNRPLRNTSRQVGTEVSYSYQEVSAYVSRRTRRWTVYVHNSDRGLQPFWASLSRAPNTTPIRVFNVANVAENITLYHTGNVRLNDTQFANAKNAIPRLFAADLDANGMLITMTGEATPTAAAELRSRGFAWYCTWGFGDPANDAKAISRRGMEMVIWGIWDTGNYDYIYEYTFRDDGQVGFRVGATGWNNSKDIPPDTPHTHDLLWRIDMYLGSGKNTARLFTHQETALSAVDSEVLFNNGIEGFTDVDPVRWSTVLIEDDGDAQNNPESRNAHGNKIGYELQPFGVGVGRHYGPYEEWTQHDPGSRASTPRSRTWRSASADGNRRLRT